MSERKSLIVFLCIMAVLVIAIPIIGVITDDTSTIVETPEKQSFVNAAEIYGYDEDSQTESNDSDFYNYEEKFNSTPASAEIGFYNIDEWGGKLIEIKSFDDKFIFEDDYGKYVIIQEGTLLWEFYTNQSQVVSSSFYVNRAYSTELAGMYSVLDNDTFSAGGYAMRIIGREKRNGVNVVLMTNGGSLSDLYIPYHLVKDETFELYKEDGSLDYYKVYINS